LSSELEYNFGCGVSGNHTIQAVVTDGELNDSVSWNLTLEYVECPVSPLGGGGGGGGKRIYCEEKWGCGEWQQCQNLKEIYEQGWVSEETNLLIKERCELMNYSEEFCGFQQRLCRDYNYCKTEHDKPGEIRECYYTENPTCNDNIKNCHDGSCEILVDCGGPCEACPSCSDGIKNQNEEGIDCGGVCRPCIELPWTTKAFKLIITYSLLILFLLAVFLVIRELIRYSKFKGMLGKSRFKNLLIKRKFEDRGIRKVVFSLLFIGFIIVLLFLGNMYIMNVANANKIVSDVSEVGRGFIASYSLINSLFRNFGLFFATAPLINENSKLVISDNTDDESRFTPCSEYCSEKSKGNPELWNVHFYADYRDTTNNPITDADSCKIKFEDTSWISMNYNALNERWEYERNDFFNKGNYVFEVNCTYNGYSNNGTEIFTITNTEPYIPIDAGGRIDFENDDLANPWLCTEDVLCIYNFSANVSEDDLNDKSILKFGYLENSNTTLTDFKINETTGILEINVTHSDYTGGKKIELMVQDSERANSAILLVNIQEVNDAPVFDNLNNQSLIVDDLFEYIINVSDEEDNKPFIFNISFESCSSEGLRGNCTLFTEDDYSADEINGKINISFTPSNNDLGSYLINFSVMDNSSLGNQTTSQIVNFTVSMPIWLEPLELNHLLTEEKEFYLNLSENVTDPESINFSNGAAFPSFNLNKTTGIINFTPDDADVGSWLVEITATSSEASSSKIFNFTINNTNDAPIIQPLSVGCDSGDCSADLNSNIQAYENDNTQIILFIEDNDFLISEEFKASFYNEKLDLNWTIQGPNETLFEFVYDEVIGGNRAKYDAVFTARNESIGNYNITINITDASGIKDVLYFNLTITNRDYDVPNITYPEDINFDLIEGEDYNLTFKANHSIGDDLNFDFYINDELRESLTGPGNNSNFTWQFTPNYTDETYGETGNLTLIVSNPFYSFSKTWNLTINHSNAPPEQIKEITDKGPVSYPYEFGIDLMDYFYDADYYDAHYNNTSEGILNFEINSNVSDSKISTRFTSDNWVYLTSVGATIESLNINASDNASSVLSNNFTVIFVPPETVPQPVPSGGSSTTIPIALKIIVPGQISAYEGETVKLPLRLVNDGKKEFKNINLNSSAFKNGSLFDEIKTSLSETFFSSLKPGKEENLTLIIELPENKTGRYEVTITATSKTPKYTDWGKIQIDLQPINESQVREKLIFTKEFIAGNPQCIEISEVIDEAENYFTAGDYKNAKAKTEEALNSCKESISQVSVPKSRIPDFMKSLKFSLYLVLAIAIALVIGLIYYFIKRRKIQKLQGQIQENRQE